jgi:hypothetical protein
MDNAHIISLGSINVDFQMRAKYRPESGETLLADDYPMTGSGKAANLAFIPQRLGVEARLLARIGDDVLAETVLGPSPAGRMQPELYPFVDYITPNPVEAEQLTGIPVQTPEDGFRSGHALLEHGCRSGPGQAPGRLMRGGRPKASGMPVSASRRCRRRDRSRRYVCRRSRGSPPARPGQLRRRTIGGRCGKLGGNPLRIAGILSNWGRDRTAFGGRRFRSLAA